MTSQAHCLIIGASHAGSQLALQLRKEGWTGSIQLLGEEIHLPYHRPPLSKAMLAGEKALGDFDLRPATAYKDADIKLKLGSRVSAVLPGEHSSVLLESGERLRYDKLALCIGSRPIHLPLGDDLEGVHYLRSASDALSLQKAIQQALTRGGKAIVIGAGYIGLEVASVLSRAGLQVTVLERASRLLSRVTGEEVASCMFKLHRAEGVQVILDTEVVSINGQQWVHSVSCADGTEYSADLVVVGIGVVPETALAQQAGLRVENGIHVDEYCRTSDPNIVAAGDCTSYHSTRYGRHIRLESVQNANDQARAAAANLCGKEQVYDALPWFWSDQYDIKLQSVGLFAGYDETVVFGDPDNIRADGYCVAYLKNGELIAADCINNARQFMAFKKAIQQGLGMDAVSTQ